jgi:hypothetical protein
VRSCGLDGEPPHGHRPSRSRRCGTLIDLSTHARQLGREDGHWGLGRKTGREWIIHYGWEFWGWAGGFFGGTALTIFTLTKTGHVAIAYGSLSSLIYLVWEKKKKEQ